MGFLAKLFPSQNEKEIKKIEKIVDKIEALEDKYKAYSDDQLINCTKEFKERVAAGENLDDLLPEAFAVVREASWRVLNMRHFRVQLIGGVVLYQGRIAEMRTGEGKTLVATLPAYLAALSGKGVHIVTVNEYLAKRDSEWMGKIFRFLGLTVGVNLARTTKEYKQAQYNCDIMYTTNNELGFDYLRDNMVRRKEDMVQRDLAFAIVDEVDSILIDEARTPLIISGRGNKSSDVYVSANAFVKTLKAPNPDGKTEEEIAGDYEIGEKEKSVFLNENGAAKAERYFKVDNLSDYENQELKHYIDNALKANIVMKRDSNYLVVDDEIIIVDEFTGRQMIGRRYSDGLHQAIEAKENVTIKSEDKTLATITFQNYFRLYKKLSGMTGTASTEKTEFDTIYSLDIVVIPTNKPIQRIDYDDQLFINQKAKYQAIIEDVKSCYEKGQPVLVGTVSVEKSEEFSKFMTKNKIPHYVLNAKNHEKEAEIIAQAGKYRAVTIATNMAGRGTDILLGGNPEYLAKQKLVKLGYSHDLIELATSFITLRDDQMDVKKARADYEKYYELFKADTDAEKEKVIAAGGLKIIGTERHESRRIDNQLRGRAGRQGDPGSSIFYLSMEDEIMRVYGGDSMKSICEKLAIDENTPITGKIITRQIENAQARVEDRNFSIRKHVLGYDDVMNTQRKVIYEQRRLVLDGMDVHEQVKAMLKAVVERICEGFEKIAVDSWDFEDLNKKLERACLNDGTNLVDLNYAIENDTLEGLEEAITNVAIEQYEEKIKNIKEELGLDYSLFEKECMLRMVDEKWMNHIDDMSELRQGISLVAYGQRDPVVVYKQEGFEMFNTMIEQIQEAVVRILFKAVITKNVEQPKPVNVSMKTNEGANSKAAPNKTITKEKKPGRNDPCPCGSGKKYKDCCGK